MEKLLKRVITLLLCVLLVSQTVFTEVEAATETMAVSTENLLSGSTYNSSFEDTTFDWSSFKTVLKYWQGRSVNGGAGSISRVSGGSAGNYAAQISPTSNHYALAASDISVSPETAYVATYYVKGLSPSSKLFLTVSQEDEAGNSTSENSYQELTFYALYGETSDFIEVKSYFRTAADAASIQFWFDASGGDVLIDDISLMVCSNDYLGDVSDCNLSFEQTGGQGANNWRAINFDSVSFNTDTYHGGSQSVNLVGSELKETAYYTCYAGIPVKEANTYQFTVYVKSRNSIGARVFLSAMGADASHIVIESVKGAETILSADSSYGEWIPISVKYTPGVDVTNVQLRIGVSKCVSADLLVDDIRLINLNEADYAEEFSSLSESGYPDDWYTEGDAKFAADGESLTVDGTGAFVRRFDELKNLNTYQFTGRFSTVGDGKVEIEIIYYDYKNQVVGSQTEPLTGNGESEWSSFEFQLETPSATYATIALKSAGGTVSFDRLQIQSVTAEVVPGAAWSAKWIWYSEDYSQCLNQTRYFRDTFELTEIPEKCIIQMTADDNMDFWVNGTNVEAAVSSEGVRKIDIAEYLAIGTNVFAFSVTNLAYECGLLYEAVPLDAAGNILGLIISDRSTMCTKTEPASDWNTVSYQEDDTWHCAKEKGRPGVQPWGLIPYDVTVQTACAFYLKDVSMEKQVQGGTMVQVTLKVDVQQVFEKEFLSWGVLWKRNSDIKVCDVKLSLDIPMKKWTVTDGYEAKLYFEVPDFIPEGSYTLQLDPAAVTVTGGGFTNNKIGSFEVAQEDFQIGYVNRSSVKSVDGNVKLYVNEKEVSPMLYLPPDTYANVQSEYVYQMAEAGISLIPIMIGSGTGGAGKIWTGVDENGKNIYNWSAYDEKIIKCIAANPQSKLLVSFDASVPQWWLDKYPAEASLNADGSTSGASFASTQWRSDMKQVMGDLIDHITSQPYAKYILGLRVTAGRTLEWLPWSDNIFDQSSATDAAFRVWLEKKYSTDAALRNAWNNSSVTLATATQPTKEQAGSQTYNTLLDVKTQMQVIDYHKFLADTTADAFLELCGYAKEKTEGNWIVGGYFGYIWNSYSYEANGTLSLAVSKVLQSDAVDYLCGPLCYDERQQGEPAPFQSMVDSLTANGKLWISENDIRTVAYQTPYNELDASAHGQTYTMSDTRSALIREFSNELIKGTGMWWYDMSGGWFNDKQIYDILTIMQEEMTANLSRARNSASEVAVFVDEDVYAYTSYNFGPVYNWLYGTNLLQRQQLATMGAPYDIYYLSDLEKGVVTKDYKVNIILNAVEIDASERASIENELKRDGKTIVWIYLPGFSDGEAMDVSNIQKVTGFDGLQLITESNSGDSVLKEGSVYTQGVAGKTIGVREYNSVMPIVSIGDTTAEALGTYSDGHGTSLAVKNMGEWTSIYSAVPELPAQLFTNILTQAGVHVYSENRDDIIFANDDYVSLHCRYGGEKTISLPENCSVYDVMNGETIDLNTDTITFTAEDNSTTLFRLTKADTVTMLTYVKGGGGRIESAGMEEVTPGTDYTVTFEAEEGYELYSVMVNDQETEANDNILKLTNVQENTRVVAVFKKQLPKEKIDTCLVDVAAIIDTNTLSSADMDNALKGVWTPFTPLGTYQDAWSEWETEAVNDDGYNYIRIEENGGKEDIGVLHFKRGNQYEHMGVAINAGMTQGETYTLKAWVKSNNATPNYYGLVLYQASDPVLASLGQDTNQGNNIKNDGEWHEVSIEFIAAKNGIYLYLHANNSASDVYVDNLKVLDNNGNDMLNGAGNFCTKIEKPSVKIEATLDNQTVSSSDSDSALEGVWTAFSPLGTYEGDWTKWETETENSSGYNYARIEEDGGKEDIGVLRFKRGGAVYEHIGVAINAGMTPGTSYILHAYVKSNAAAPWGGLMLYDNGNGVLASIGEGNPIPNDGAWHEVSLEFTAVKTGIYLFLNGGNYTSDVYIDNIRIRDCDGNDMLDGLGNFTSEAVADICQFYEDISSYRGDTNTEPEKDGYLFAGWYEDFACTKAISSERSAGEAYAKFVDKNVLAVKAQIKKGTTETSEKTDMRFVTTVDSLNYKEVGFEITVDGRPKQTHSLSKVYKKLYAEREGKGIDTLVPSEAGSVISMYFTTYAYWNIPKANFDTKFTVTPYWITLDGTTVYGETTVKTVSMGYR